MYDNDYNGNGNEIRMMIGLIKISKQEKEVEKRYEKRK